MQPFIDRMPALYIADDSLLPRISDYVKKSGHVVLNIP